jgi:hypothetical protein
VNHLAAVEPDIGIAKVIRDNDKKVRRRRTNVAQAVQSA